MVSSRVITPATYSPWFEGRSRNLAKNPRATAIGGGGWVSNNFGTNPNTMGVTPPLAHPLGIATAMEQRSTGVNNALATVYNVDGLGNAGTPQRTLGMWVLVTEPGYASNGVDLSPYMWTFVRATAIFAAGAFSVFTVGKTVGFASTTARAYLTAAQTEAGPAPVGDYYDGDFLPLDANLEAYSWESVPNASSSVYSQRTLLKAEVTAPVYETIVLESPVDSITFFATPTPGGFVYDNESLQRWYEIADIEAPVNKRPNAHGAYSLGQTFTKEHRPLLSGRYFGLTSIDAKAQRERLVGMFNDGLPIMMRVTDESGATASRQVWLTDYEAPFSYDFSYFTFDLELTAPDPRRYGATYSTSTGMPTPGSGLLWNLGKAPSGLFFDWGTAGELGEVSFTNTGAAPTLPRIEVGGTGTLVNGFRVVEIETGRELTYTRTVTSGQVIILDSRTERATIAGGGDVTAALSSRKWFEIPRGQTRRYQIVPLGVVVGTPTMTLITAPANL